MSAPGPRGEQGFTIVEVLAAVVVMLVGLLSLVGLFDDSRDQNATGERAEIAVMQAEQAIEEMRGIPYANLLLSSGATDPTAGQRVLSAGANFQVKPDKTEPLVYYSTEGKPLSDAWVDPVTTVQIGVNDAPLDLTIHRFITWRDEECGLAPTSNLGVNLPGSINDVQVPLSNLVNTVLQNLLAIVSGSTNNTLNILRNRLDGLENALLAREGQLGTALAGIAELDLCDISLSLLSQAQALGRLNDGLVNLNTPAANDLRERLVTLQNSLSGICLPIIGCILGQTQTTAINAVNAQLDCMFGSTTDTEAEFDSYLSGVLTGLQNLANDVSNTVKNSKRITVAVVVEPRNGVGPIQPVWMSSVVRDPGAGLLTSGSATCT